jgi:hypothetical protein
LAKAAVNRGFTMLSQKYTRHFLTEHRPLAPAALVMEEGVSMVYVKVPGQAELHVQPSTGAAGEVLAGLSWTRNAPPAHLVNVVEGVVPASGKVELRNVPVTGQIMVKVAGDQKVIVAGAPASADEAELVGKVVTLHASAVGQAYFIQSLYEPTVVEARQILGDMPIGGLASQNEGIIGLLVKADAATTYFDASVDWNGPEIHPTLGTDGRLTVGGTPCKNLIIVSAPSADVPYLTVRVNV